MADPLANLQIVIGPAVVLGLGQAAYIARMAAPAARGREDYVRTARAKGLSGRLRYLLHALPMRCCRDHAKFAGLVLAGSIPVERAFEHPLGYAMFTAVSERDVS
jgi:peptide/nickel transport system permease protein